MIIIKYHIITEYHKKAATKQHTLQLYLRRYDKSAYSFVIVRDYLTKAGLFFKQINKTVRFENINTQNMFCYAAG